MGKEKTSRIETLDLLRGYFLLVILLNHLHFYPSGLEYITGQSFLYASTAEGFFLISGIVLGIIRGAKLIDKPFRHAAKLLLKRSAQLYITSIILVILFTLIGWLFLGDPGLKPGIFQPPHDFLTMILQTVTLQYTYGWADYLRLYAIFIFFSPIALWLLRKKLWYVLIGISLGVWALYSVSPLGPGWKSVPLSWQLIFFIGLTIGFHWKNITGWWQRQTVRFKKALTGVLVTAAGMSLVTCALLVFGGGIPGIGEGLTTVHHAVEGYFEKDRLPLTRVLLFGLWFIGLFWLFTRFQPFIKKYLGWLFHLFGTNSLYVYTVQAFVVFAVVLIFNGSSKYWFVNLAISVGTIAIVWLAARTKFLAKIIPR